MNKSSHEMDQQDARSETCARVLLLTNAKGNRSSVVPNDSAV